MLDGSNSFNKIIEYFDGKGLDEEFLSSVSLYVDDMRLLNNVNNEFEIYGKRIDCINLDKNKLLAIILYKNIFPDDFSELQMNKGYVYSVFDRKNRIVQDKVNDKNSQLIEIGEKPILWHIMKLYSHYGFNDFVILTGYKSHVIKDYFVHYYQQYSDITVDMQNNSVEIHKMQTEPWKVTMLYTGQNTMTGSRIKKAQEYIGNEPFMLTYGDGVADIDINKLIRVHKSSGKILTLTAVKPFGKFGALNISNDGSIDSSLKILEKRLSINDLQ